MRGARKPRDEGREGAGERGDHRVATAGGTPTGPRSREARSAWGRATLEGDPPGGSGEPAAPRAGGGKPHSSCGGVRAVTEAGAASRARAVGRSSKRRV